MAKIYSRGKPLKGKMSPAPTKSPKAAGLFRRLSTGEAKKVQGAMAATTHPFNPKYHGAGGSQFEVPKGSKMDKKK